MSLLIGPRATVNEFLLNTKVTITYPSSPPPPHTLYPSPLFCHCRKANMRAGCSNKNCCLSASLQMITCLPLNCLSSLHPSCHLCRFTKRRGEEGGKMFFVRCSVPVTGFSTESFIIILIQPKRLLFQLHIISPVLERFSVLYLPHLGCPDGVSGSARQLQLNI